MIRIPPNFVVKRFAAGAKMGLPGNFSGGRGGGDAVLGKREGRRVPCSALGGGHPSFGEVGLADYVAWRGLLRCGPASYKQCSPDKKIGSSMYRIGWTRCRNLSMSGLPLLLSDHVPARPAALA